MSRSSRRLSKQRQEFRLRKSAESWSEPTDLLPMEKEVRRLGFNRASKVKVLGCPFESGLTDPSGCTVKKTLKLARLREGAEGAQNSY